MTIIAGNGKADIQLEGQQRVQWSSAYHQRRNFLLVRSPYPGTVDGLLQ